MLKMILEDGFFHADPRCGNVCYLPDNRLAFIDLGMLGRISEERRCELALLIRAFSTRSASDASSFLSWRTGSLVRFATRSRWKRLRSSLSLPSGTSTVLGNH